MRKETKTHLIILLYVVIYFTGICFIKQTDIEGLKDKGMAQQEEYYGYDYWGDDVEGESLIEIKGLGSILTYKDVYLASIFIVFVCAILGEMLFDRTNMLPYVVIAKVVLGLFLIWLAKGNIIPTIFYWATIIIAYIESNKTD